MSYRPKEFPKFSNDYVPPIPESFNTIFNWGADAMLEALKGDAVKTGLGYGINVCVKHGQKGYLVFIPEEE